MFFINPTWDNESECIGKQKCMPLGYALHVISDLIGFISLLLLFGTGAYLAYRGIVGTFRPSLLWAVVISFAFAFLGWVLYHCSWCLASKKGFRYDYEAQEASWRENGERRTYRWKA